MGDKYGRRAADTAHLIFYMLVPFAMRAFIYYFAVRGMSPAEIFGLVPAG